MPNTIGPLQLRTGDGATTPFQYWGLFTISTDDSNITTYTLQMVGAPPVTGSGGPVAGSGSYITGSFIVTFNVNQGAQQATLQLNGTIACNILVAGNATVSYSGADASDGYVTTFQANLLPIQAPIKLAHH